MKTRTKAVKRNSNVRRQSDPLPFKYGFLTVICGLFLVFGFFMAARSHFATMDYGMKNAKLRQQIEELKSENRRLQLSKEMALTPAEIKKAAKKLGLTTMTARNIEVVGAKKPEEKEIRVTENTETELKTFADDKPQVNRSEKTENISTEKDAKKTVTEKRKDGKTESGKIRNQIAKK